MATNQTNNRRIRDNERARRPLVDENGNKSNKFANAGAGIGAAAGGFVGAMGSSFVPPINVTVNNNKSVARPGGGGGHGHQSLLPAPEFTSPAQVRNYCNTLRAAGVTLSIEVAMAAEILKAVLAAVPDPEGRAFGSRIRAAKVARKLNRAADDLRHAARDAAACYSAFQQEYEEEINRVRHRARKPQTPVINWAQQ